jgi:hypothetical protein
MLSLATPPKLEARESQSPGFSMFRGIRKTPPDTQVSSWMGFYTLLGLTGIHKWSIYVMKSVEKLVVFGHCVVLQLQTSDLLVIET